MRPINFLPEDRKKAEQVRLLKKSIMISSGIVFLTAMIIYAIIANGMSQMKQQMTRSLDLGETSSVVRLRHHTEELFKEEKALLQQHKDLMQRHSMYLISHKFFKRLGDFTQGRVWLTSIALDTTHRTCILDGRSFHTRWVSDFMLELKKMPFLEKVDLVTMDKNEKAHQETVFRISCEFN